MRDVREIQPARGQVGGDENGGPFRIEFKHHGSSPGLAFVPMNRDGSNPVTLQTSGDFVSTPLGAGEDKCLGAATFLEKPSESCCLMMPFDEVDGL